jgi:hypothetical protein
MHHLRPHEAVVERRREAARKGKGVTIGRTRRLQFNVVVLSFFSFRGHGVALVLPFRFENLTHMLLFILVSSVVQR